MQNTNNVNSTHVYAVQQVYLCKKPVDKDWFGLPEAVGPEHSLEIVGGVPTGIEYDHSIGRHQVDTKGTSTCRD